MQSGGRIPTQSRSARSAFCVLRSAFCVLRSARWRVDALTRWALSARTREGSKVAEVQILVGAVASPVRLPCAVSEIPDRIDDPLHWKSRPTAGPKASLHGRLLPIAGGSRAIRKFTIPTPSRNNIFPSGKVTPSRIVTTGYETPKKYHVLTPDAPALIAQADKS